MNAILSLLSGQYTGIVITLLIAALVIWVIFYVLPLPQMVRTILAVAVAVILLLWLLNGCATNTGDPVKDAHGKATNQALADAAKVLGQVGMSILFNTAKQELSGGKVDFGSAASQGLWQNIDVIGTAQEARSIALTWSGGNAPKTAAAVQRVFQSVAADERAPVIVNAVAQVISTAAGAPPKK